MQSMFHGVREYLTPVLTESSFEEKGRLTPEEFVAAGDLLVYKCPTWRWESGEKDSMRPYLPEDKQYLVTRNVPCRRRVNALDLNYQAEQAVDDEDDWIAASSYASTNIATDTSDPTTRLEHISLDDQEPTDSNPMSKSGGGILDNIVDEYAGGSNAPPDLSSFEEDNLVEDDATLGASGSYLVATEPGENDDSILHTRTYDLSITYDKYYQTPRMWLFGFDEENKPLSKDAVFEDIMQDYANQTVTMEPHPHHPSLVHASIHPCQHAAVMKRIVDNMRGGESGHELRSDQYLFLFLKFIQSVVPTIDYDYTIEV